MKKPLLLLLFLLCLSPLLRAQTWLNTIKLGGTSSDQAEVMATDAQGNKYLYGYFFGSVTILGTTLNSTSSASHFLIKLTPQDQIAWVQEVPNTINTTFYNADLEVDAQGNIYLSDYRSRTSIIDFGNGVILPSNPTGSFRERFLVKYNSSGLAQWVSSFASQNSTNDLLRGLAVTQGGELYVATNYTGGLTYNGSAIISNVNTSSAALLRIQPSNGALVWSKNLTPDLTGQFLFAQDLHLKDNETTLVLVGYQANTQCFTCPFSGYQDTRIYIAEYKTGTLTAPPLSAVTRSNATAGEVSRLCAATNSTGEVFISANFENSVSFGSRTLQAISFFDAFVAKLDSSNNWDFVRQLSTPTTIGTNSILATDSSVFVTITNDNFVFIDSSFLVRARDEDVVGVLQFNREGDYEQFFGIGNIASNFIFGYTRDVVSLAPGLSSDTLYGLGSFTYNAIFSQDTLFATGSRDVFYSTIDCKPRPISRLIGDTVVCLGNTTYSLPPTSFGPGVDYQWTISGGGTFTQGDTFITVNWNTVGTHTLSVQAFNSCGGSGVYSIQVNVIDIPGAQPINGDSTACLGQAAYNVPSNPFNQYNWSVSGGGNLFPISNTAIINWVATGNYTLQVQASNECGTGPLSSFPITVKSIPSAPSPITGSNNTCVSTQSYSVTAQPDVNYSWSLSSGGTLTSNGNTATINWATAGTHTLVVTPSNNCGVGSSRTLQIVVTDVPQQPSTVVGNLSVCRGSSNSYSVVGDANTSYSWSLSSGGILTGNGSTINVTWTAAGTHTLTVTPSNVCGTGTPRTVNVTVSDVPQQAGAIIGIDTVCIGQQSYQVPPVPGVNYTWTLSSGGTLFPNGSLATVNWTTPGTHTLTVTTYNNCGTGTQRTIPVVVKNISTAFTTITGADTACLGIENYSVPLVGGFTYNWSLTGGGQLTTINNSAFVDWTGTGIYTLRVATSDGCNSAINVNVKDAPAQPEPISGDTLVCLGTSNYGVNFERNVQYSWTLSGGGQLIENDNLATVTWTSTGTHTLTVTPFNDCGTGTPRTLQVTVASIPSAPSAIAGDTLVCLGNTLYNVPLQANADFQWSISGSGATLSNSAGAAITANWQTPGTYQLRVTATNQCGTSAQTVRDITVIDLPSSPTLTGVSADCLDSATFAAQATFQPTFAWNLSSGGALNASNDTARVTWSNTGTHTLTVTASNQCGIAPPVSQAITVSDIPAAPASLTGNLVVCQGVQSYSVPQVVGVNYNWSISGGGAITALGNTATINWTTPGIYTLTVTPLNNCGTGAALIRTIVVGTTPQQPSIITGPATTCLATASYSVTLDTSVTYSWSVSGGGQLSFNGNTATVIWQTPGTYTLTAVPQSLCGTGLPRTLTVQVSDVPDRPQLTTGDTLVCQGTQLYSVGTRSGVSYTWSISGGGTLTSSANNATVNWNTDGIHTLTVTPSNTCGNGLPLSLSANVGSAPSPLDSIAGDDSHCLGSAPYSITPRTGENYTWSLSSGGQLSTSGTTATVDWLSPGSHTLSVVASNRCGVAPPTSLVVTVGSVPSQPLSIAGDRSICENTSTTYTVTAITGVNYQWSVSGGGTVTPTTNAATIDWNTPGTFTVSVTPFNSCGSGIAQTLAVTVRPNDLISTAIEGDTTVCLGSDAFYSADFNPNLSYTWLLDRGGNLRPLNNGAVINWQTVGTAQIGLVAQSDCGIGDTARLTVTVEAPLSKPTIVRSGDSLIVSPAINLTWYLDETAIPITTPYLIPQVDGVYTATNRNICGESPLSDPVEIGAFASGLYLYPNPARNQVTLHLPQYLQWYYLDVVDFAGRNVMETIDYNGTDEVLLDIRKLHAGMYVVRIYTELGYFNRTFLVH